MKSDEACAKHFPLTITYSDYCHAGPTLRDPRARIVTLEVKNLMKKKSCHFFSFCSNFDANFCLFFFKFKLSTLPLDDHAREKIIRLLGSERYDRATDLVTIVADRCPSRQQNIDYVTFLLTALFNEASVCFLFQFFFQLSFGLYCISNFFSLKRLGLFSLSIFFPIKL